MHRHEEAADAISGAPQLPRQPPPGQMLYMLVSILPLPTRFTKYLMIVMEYSDLRGVIMICSAAASRAPEETRGAECPTH